jgi:hypothetical protein
MRRLILALVVGTGLFGVVFAAAASLNLGSSGNLQAGQSVVGQCQGATPVSITYQVVANGPTGYAVNAVTFGGIQPSCNGKVLQVQFFTSAGAPLMPNAAYTLPTTASTAFSFTISGLSIDASQLNSATVAILN